MFKPSLAVWLLRAILIFNGAITLFAAPAVFFPTSWLASLHEASGLGDFPDEPVVQYLARSASALYAMLGALTLVLAWDVKRYSLLITGWGASMILFGILIFWIDHTAGMPLYWTWGEGPYLVLTGVLALIFQVFSTTGKVAHE